VSLDDTRPRIGRITLTLALALGAALVFRALGAPLPWIIGPLATTALLSARGAPVAEWPPLRNAGQWAIGCVLGLYFTPDVVRLLPALGWAIAAGVVWALLLGIGFAAWLRRLVPAAGAPTAFFAGAIGGASEMAVLAERQGARVDLVAAAHSLRVLIVVVLVPFGFQAAGLHGVDPAPLAVHQFHLGGFLGLAALTAAGAGALKLVGVPNPFVLGALAVTAGVSASGVELSALPPGAAQAGQLFIGVSLGTRFTPAFVHTAPRWLAGVALGTLAMIVLSAGFAWGLATLAGLHPATVTLATSPGGIAEMCITAQALQLGVPVVTAFHVVRYVAVLLLTAPLYRRLNGVRAP
jgi:uncharacterized protein